MPSKLPLNLADLLRQRTVEGDRIAAQFPAGELKRFAPGDAVEPRAQHKKENENSRPANHVH